MKKLFKKTLALIFAAVMLMTAAPQSGLLAPEASAADSGKGWEDAYYNFIISGGFTEYFICGENYTTMGNDPLGPRFGLKDMNNDGIPELLVADPWESGTYGHGNIYTYKDGKVVYAGYSDNYGGHWAPHITNDENYPGVYAYLWYRDEFNYPNGMPFHILYCSFDGEKTTIEDVAADYYETGVYERITDDIGLYNAIINGKSGKDYQLTYLSEFINNGQTGWQNFIKSYSDYFDDKNTGSDKLGDLNADGNINSSDALTVLQYAVGQIKLTGEMFNYADVNRDKQVNSSDALKILQYSVGQINKF